MKQHIITNDLQALFLKGTIGIEREGQRVLEQGVITQTEHPSVFGARQYHPYIQTDFAESQLELITPARETEQEVYQFLHAIHDVVLQKMPDNEYIWPLSMPSVFPAEDDIKEAQLNAEDTAYREYLSKKYGKYKQMVSGIHYNFGLSHEFVQAIENISAAQMDRNAIYLKLARQFMRYQWVLVYLFGASPIAEDVYFTGYDKLDRPVRSIRASQYGYVNKSSINIPFDTLENYVNTLEEYVARGELIAEKEFYSSVRFRGVKKARELLSKGTQYMEFRLFDLNPFAPYGITEDDMRFIHLFLLMLLWIDEENSQQSVQIGKEKSEKIALSHPLEQPAFMKEGQWLMKQLLDMATHCYLSKEDVAIIRRKMEQLTKPEQTVGGQLWQLYQEKQDMTTIGMELAKQYKQAELKQPYGLKAFAAMELSTQALLFDAIQYGLAVDILDETDQFVKLSYQGHEEYVKNGNMTSQDSYISPLIMENKVVTKKVLAAAGFNVPQSLSCRSLEEAKHLYPLIKHKAIVVKPKSTNFGLGITIFKTANITDTDFYQAVEIALKEDKEVLIEDFIRGIEYRFFVLNHETKAVLLRVPANVIGDGVHTIAELVALKNEQPLRGDGVRTPLKKIKLGHIEQLQLRQQGYTPETIIDQDTIVFLRENSNISTGGDSVDMTDHIHESYKQLAVNIAQTMMAKVCGVDLIIPDITVPVEAGSTTYSVIEANFNPMMMMHIYPASGESRRLTTDIIQMLFPELKLDKH